VSALPSLEDQRVRDLIKEVANVSGSDKTGQYEVVVAS
jgi:hypothetical protein